MVVSYAPSGLEPLTQTFEGKVGSAPLPARISVVGKAGDPYVLSQGSCIIGAGKDADLIVNDETVSRRHLELTLVPEGVQLVDLGSHNGTFFLGQRIQRVILSLGSLIRLGRVELRLDADETALRIQKLTGHKRVVFPTIKLVDIAGVCER